MLIKLRQVYQMNCNRLLHGFYTLITMKTNWKPREITMIVLIRRED